MAINRDKPDLWKEDIIQSTDLYNSWFMEFAPQAFRETRGRTASKVEDALEATNYLQNISVDMLKTHPEVLQILRMSTCPPIARERLVGLAGVPKNLVESMEDAEEPHLPPRMSSVLLEENLGKIAGLIRRMADPDIFTWLFSGNPPGEVDVRRSATVIADRLCGAVADPIIRNAQEKRQLAAIKGYLVSKGYCEAPAGKTYDELEPGSFGFHANVPGLVVATDGQEPVEVNVSIDVIVKPFGAAVGDLPILIEAKSAGDFTNVNKRRKEEASKMQNLKNRHGDVSYNLFLCGYFDSGYLGYEAAEGIDWIWEHRITDIEQLGI